MASRNPKTALMFGAAWAIGLRWSIKGIGFVNTVIMARLLLPEDYGVVAMAFLIVGLVQALLDFGVGTALLRKDQITSSDLNAAWSLMLIQGAVIGAILVAASPLAAIYFKEERVATVMQTFAVALAFGNGVNPGFILARKQLNFALDFRHQVICKILSVAATVLCALYTHDYRALVFGVVFGWAISLVLTYVMHPYRPRWQLDGVADIWAVSKWLMVSGVGNYLLRKTDEFAAARIGSVNEFGLYNVGADVGQLPTGELGPAMLKALLPVLSGIQNDTERTNAAVVKTIRTVNTLTMPVGLGAAAVALPMTTVVLGANWEAAAPFVAAFAIAGTAQFIASPMVTLLTLRGFTKAQSRVVWAEFLCFVVLAAVLVPHLQLLGLVLARIIASICSGLLILRLAHRLCGLSARAAASSLLRPLLGAAGMHVIVAYLLSLLTAHPPWLQLAVGITAGGVFYSLWTAVTWLLAGRPEGLESTVLDLLRRRI